MLRAAADFPHPGALAYLRESAAPARIMRHNGDGSTLVSLQPTNADPLIGRLASGSRTVPTDSLKATAEEACGLDPAGRPLRANGKRSKAV